MSFGGRQSFGGGRQNSRGGPTSRRKKKPTYSFPILNAEEIVACMSELGIEVTEQEVINPKPVIVHEVYVKLTEYCMGITAEEMSQGKFEGLAALSFPELHERSVPEIAYWRTVSKLMDAAQVPDFSFLMDCVKPIGERFIRNLSAIINFAKFREERVQSYSEMTASTEEILEQKQRLITEQQQLKEKIQRLKSQQLKDIAEAVDIEAENEGLSNEIKELNQKQSKMKYESGKVKEQSKTVQGHIQATKFKILGAREECDQIRSQIINSPEKIKSQLKAMEFKVERLQKESMKQSNALNETEGQLLQANKLKKEMERILTIMEQVEVSINDFKAARHDRQNAEKEIEKNGSEGRELEAMVKRYDRQVTALKDKVVKMQKDRRTKEAAAKQCLTDAQNEYEELLQNRTTSNKEKDRLTNEIDMVRNDMETLKMEFENEKERVTTTYKKLENSVSAYHDRLFGANITNNNNNFKSGTTIPSTNLKKITTNYSSESNSSSSIN